MKAILSGQAGVALTSDRPMTVLRIGRPDREIRDVQEVVRLFDGCSDVRRVQLRDLAAIRAELEREEAFSDALKLFLFLIDPSEPEEDLVEYAECVEELTSDAAVFEKLQSRMYSAVLPHLLELNRINLACISAPVVGSLVHDLVEHQAAIQIVRESFDRVAPSLFGSGLEKDRTRQALIDQGAFADLARSLKADGDLNFIRLQLRSAFRAQQEAISQWTAMIAPGGKGIGKRPSILAPQRAEDDIEELVPFVAEQSHVAFQQIRAQQRAIIQRLKDRDLDGARKYTAELISGQRTNSTAEQIAKSLSFLAMQAKRQDVPELQLEWAEWAEKENPMDPLTSGHLADAFIFLGHYSEAEKALDRTESLGNVVYASTGRGRILRALGRYEEARQVFLETAEKFADLEGIEYAHAGAAETLRDQGAYLQAHTEYLALTRRWPTEETFWNGLASTELDLGRFHDALKTYGKAGQTPVSRNGRATVHKTSGQLDEAAALFDEVLTDFPNNHVALIGRAEVLRLRGRLDEAIAAYETATERCPFLPQPFAGLAATLSEQRRHDHAIAVLKGALSQFPQTAHLHVGLAKAMRKKGEIESALGIVEECLRQFPDNIPALAVRSDLLRELDQPAEAMIVLDRILADHPYSQLASAKKAALLIAQGDTAAAKALLPDTEPRSSWDWTRYILRAEIAVIEEGAGKAVRLFSRGVERCPFYRQRVLLRSAWASAELGRRRLRDARRLVEASPTEIEPIVRFNVYASTHRPGHARRTLDEIMASSRSGIVIDLASEIARRHGLIAGNPIHDDAWIEIRSRTALMLEAA